MSEQRQIIEDVVACSYRLAAASTTWTLFFVGSLMAVMLATLLTLVIPRLYPWGPETVPA